MKKIVEIKSFSTEFLQLVFEMRIIMSKLNKSEKIVMMSDVMHELEGYFSENRRIFVYQENNKMIGYSILKIEEDVCWLDWLYVDPDFRGKEVGSELFDHAEKFAKKIGGDQLYIWIHPDNKPMIRFLKKKGYDVLNLIEIKKTKNNSSQEIDILGNKFNY